MTICVDNKVKSFAGHKMQRVYNFRFDVADFRGDDCERVIFNLHGEWTNIDSSVDNSEAVSIAFFNVKY